MDRLILALAALTGLAAQSGPEALIERYGAGGVSTSPDGHWRVVAMPNRSDDPYARATLEGPGVKRGIDYLRMLRVFWPRDGRHLILLHIALDGEVLTVHSLASRDAVAPDTIERGIERQMRQLSPSLEDVGRQEIALGLAGTTPCVLVSQSGTPKGHRTGSFVTRNRAFRLDLERGRAIPVPACPGAVLA